MRRLAIAALVLLPLTGCSGKRTTSRGNDDPKGSRTDGRNADPPPKNERNEASDREQARLVGTWVATDGEFQGVRMAPEALKDFRWKFTPDNVTYTELGRNVEATCTFNPATNPPSFDFKGSGTAIQGIYELNGDMLRVCFAATERPKCFATGGTSMDTIGLVFKRAGR